MYIRKQNGFTIVELLIVIVVIAILTSVTVVAYNGISQRSYGAKAASTVDAYVKILNLYKVNNGTFPTFNDAGGYKTACLVSAGALPAEGLFLADECDAEFGFKVSNELNTKLLTQVKSLPDGRLPVVRSVNSFDNYVRAVTYTYFGTGDRSRLLYYLNGDYVCPRGNTSSANAGTTECTLELD